MLPDRAAIGRRRVLALGALAIPAMVAGCGHRSAGVTGHPAPVSAEGPPPATFLTRPSTTTSAAPATVVDAARYAGQVPQQWGTDLPGIESTLTRPADGTRTMALTLDACGGAHGSSLDTRVLEVLAEYAIPATVFLNERWIRANLAETERLVANPLLRVENHGSVHVPLSVTGRAAYGIAGTVNAAGVIEEIESNRELLRSLGVESTWFRAGTAHYDEVAVSIARDLGVRLAGFTVNADFGATATAAVVEAQVLAAPDGAIVLAHVNQPTSGTASGLRSALSALVNSGVRFRHLDGAVL